MLSPGYGEPSKKCENFWLFVLLHSEPILRNLIEPNDVPILRFLSDVRSEPVRLRAARQFPPSTEDECCDVALGYDILFEFLPNPFFSNTVLSKRYLIDVMPDQCDYINAPHGDVLAGGWSGSGKIDVEVLSDECKESMLCQSILNQDHSIDKLLDYNGPQVIAIQGCQIKWYNAAKEATLDNELLSADTKDNMWEGRFEQIKDRASNKSFDLNLSDDLEQSPTFLKTNLSPVAGRLSKEFSFSNLFFPNSTLANNVEVKHEHPDITSFFSGPFFSSSKTSRPSGSNESLKSGFSAGTKISGETVVLPGTSNPQNSLGSNLNSPFRVPEVPKKSNGKLSKSKERKSGLSLLDFRGIFQRHLGPTTKEPEEETFDLAKQFPFPRASPYSSETVVAPSFQDGETNQWVRPKNSSKNMDFCPPVSKGTQDIASDDSRSRSFFDFFEINWNEKSPDHCKEISRDYQIGSYIRDVVIPRAYVFYRQKDLTDQDRECQDHHVITSIGNRYDKEFRAPSELEISTNYDEIDDEIPLAISKQAMKTIQASESVKQEILEHNKQTATRIANSFIGRMMRRHDGLLDDIMADDVDLPSKKCHSSIFGKNPSKNDVAVTSSQSYTTKSVNLLHRIHKKFAPKKKVIPNPHSSISDEDFKEAPQPIILLGSHSSGTGKQFTRPELTESSEGSVITDVASDDVNYLTWSTSSKPDDIDEEIDILSNADKSQDAAMSDVFAPFQALAANSADGKSNEIDDITTNIATNNMEESKPPQENVKAAFPSTSDNHVFSKNEEPAEVTSLFVSADVNDGFPKFNDVTMQEAVEEISKPKEAEPESFKTGDQIPNQENEK